MFTSQYFHRLRHDPKCIRKVERWHSQSLLKLETHLLLLLLLVAWNEDEFEILELFLNVFRLCNCDACLLNSNSNVWLFQEKMI